MGFPGGSEDKASACNAVDPGSIPGLGRSSGEGNGNPLQYSCLEYPMDRGAWWATVHSVAKSRMWLSNWTHIVCGDTLGTLMPRVEVERIRPADSGLRAPRAGFQWIWVLSFSPWLKCEGRKARSVEVVVSLESARWNFRFDSTTY